MSKYDGHTPGPWTYIDDGIAYDSEIVTIKGVIAEIKDTYDGLPEHEFLANARLIADAPMLAARVERLEAALKAFIESYERMSFHDEERAYLKAKLALEDGDE